MATGATTGRFVAGFLQQGMTYLIGVGVGLVGALALTSVAGLRRNAPTDVATRGVDGVAGRGGVVGVLHTGCATKADHW